MQTDTSLNQVSVFGKVYRLAHIEDTQGLEHPSGRVCHTPQTIHIYGYQGFEQERDTVLHEVLHAIDYAMQLSLEEHQVHALAASLLSVLRDNAAFVAYLCEPRA